MSKQTIDPATPSGLIQKVDDNFDEIYSVLGDGTDLNKVTISITAGTTQTQGQQPLTATVNIVGTVANADDVVTLKSFSANGFQYVYNDGANILQVFPASGQDLGNGANASTQLYPGHVLKAVCTASNVIRIDNSHNTISVNVITGNETLPANEMFGYTHYVTGAATVTLPAVEDGMNAVFHTIGAIAVSIDPNASDLIYLDGAALDDGDKITNLSTAGDIAAISYYDSTGFYAATNGWTDGGA